MDDAVANDLASVKRSCSASWLEPIVTVEKSDNPFIPRDFSDVKTNHAVLASRTGCVLTSRQNILSVSKVGRPDSTSSPSLVDSVVRPTDPPSLASSLDLVHPSQGETARSQICLHHLDCAFEFLEPILCTAFLYSPAKRIVLSDPWHFFPDQCGTLLPTGCRNVRSVWIEGELALTERNPYLVVLLRRLAGPDGGAPVLQYYQDGTIASVKAARDCIANRRGDIWQTFAFTFSNYSAVKDASEPVMFPAAYLAEHPFGERDVQQCIIDANLKHWPQILFKPWFSAGGPATDRIIRLVANDRPMPYTWPINQLTVALDRLTLVKPKFKANERLFVSLSLKDDTGKAIPAIESRFGTRMAEVRSEAIWDLANPVFCDSFVVNLPFPMTSAPHLEFVLMKIKVQSGSTHKLAEGELPILDRSGLVVADASVKLEKHALSVRLGLRSALLFSNAPLKTFFDMPARDFKLLNQVPPALLIQYLYPIVDILVEGFTCGYRNALDVFMQFIGLITGFLKEKALLELLLRYKKFYAFPGEFQAFEPLPGKQFEIGIGNWPLPLKILYFIGGFFANEESEIVLVVPFFFGLVIKRLKLNPFDPGTHPFFTAFVAVLAHAVLQSKGTQLLESTGAFVEQLFDLGYASASLQVIEAILRECSNHQRILPYLLMLPSFPFLVRHSSDFRDTVVTLLREAYSSVIQNSLEHPMFSIFLGIVSCCDDNLQQSLANQLSQVVTIFKASELTKLDTALLLLPIAVFRFFVSYADSLPPTQAILEMIALMLRTINVDSRCGHLTSVLKAMSVEADVSLSRFIRVFHQLLNVIVMPECLNQVVIALAELLTLKQVEFFFVSSPCLVRVIRTMFIRCSKADDCHETVYNFVVTMYHVDESLRESTIHANVIVIRAISILELDVLRAEEFKKFTKKFSPKFPKLVAAFEAAINEHVYFDYYSNVKLLFSKFEQFADSPDAQCDILQTIVEFHSVNNRGFEATTAYLFQAGIILEYLIKLRKIPDYFHRVSPSSILYDFCPFISELPKYIKYSRLFPSLPSFCDSPYFSLKSLLSILFKVLAIYEKHELFDLAASLLNVLCPILESLHGYADLAELMQKYQQLFERFKKSDTLDTFWRVAFPDGKNFVYRFRPMAKRGDFQAYLTATYGQVYSSVEVLADTEELDPEKGNVTVLRFVFVEPCNSKGQPVRERFSHFFTFSTPFVPGSKRAHGGAAEQCLRRAVYRTEFPLPNFLGRSAVVQTTFKDLSPIQFAYVNLMAQTERIAEAVTGDVHELQPLLAGTWAVQVNAGPREYINVFLKDAPETKYTMRLRRAYAAFMIASKEGLRAHGFFATGNPKMQPIQTFMEASYQAFEEVLLPHMTVP
jgi:hypothetical protein